MRSTSSRASRQEGQDRVTCGIQPIPCQHLQGRAQTLSKDTRKGSVDGDVLLVYMLRSVELGLGPDLRMQSVPDLSQPYCPKMPSHSTVLRSSKDQHVTSKPPGIQSSPPGPGWRFQSGADRLGSLHHGSPQVQRSTVQTSRKSRAHRV